MGALTSKQIKKDFSSETNFRFHSRSITPETSFLRNSHNHDKLVQRKAGCPCGGHCPRCKHHPSLQPKLIINKPRDRYEQEADRVADQVIRMTDEEVSGISHVDTNIQRKCASCASGDLCPECEQEDGGLVQRKLGDDSNAHHISVAGSVIDNLGPGQPLDPSTRAFMESRFGHDFSNVRVHTDANAAESAQSLNALACTYGENIIFGNRKYAPQTVIGRKLIAHELVHTIQQAGSEVAGKMEGSVLQRTIGDLYDLRSERFRGDPVLEACFDNERTLHVGNSGEAVVKVQRALEDLGYSLPNFGVDGIFGSETSKAVREFQADNGLVMDGVVGFRTINKLDLAFAQPIPQRACGQPDVPQPPGVSDVQMMEEGNGLSLVMKGTAHTHLVAMRERVFEGKMNQVPTTHQDWTTLRAAQRWLNIHVGRRAEFLTTVDGAIQRVSDSLSLSVQLVARRGTHSPSNCVGCNQATAIVGDPNGVINHCELFFHRGPLCRRDLNMHERFHLVGAPGHGTPASTPAGALNNVQNLVELMRDVNRQSNGHCDAGR